MANRMYVSLMVLVILILLFHLGGFFSDPNVVDCTDDTSLSSLSAYTLRNLGLTCPENLGSTKFYTTLVLLLSITTAGIFIGSFVNITPENVVFTTVGIPLIGILFLFAWDIVGIYNILSEVNEYFALMIASPMIVAWLFTIYEFAMRKD